MLFEISQLDAGLVIFVPDIRRTHDGTNGLEVRMGPGFIAVYVIPEGVDQRIGDDNPVAEVHLALRGHPHRRAVGVIAVIFAVKGGVRAGARIAREAARNGVIRQQHRELVEATGIKFLRQ
ncbi:hypothetical protein D3C86_1898500 [compost metagenome]